MTLFVKCEFKVKPLITREYKKLKAILDDSVYLTLDLEYNEDYSLKDIDEVKDGNFDRKLLEMMYTKANVNENYMEYWNSCIIGKT